MSTNRFVLVLIGFALLTGVALALLLREPSGCGQLSAVPESSVDTPVHKIVVEFSGNTTEWQAEVASFLINELHTSSEGTSNKPLAVQLALVKNGARVRPQESCLRSELVLKPAAGDLYAYNAGSKATKDAKMRSMKALRERQVSWFADAVVREIRETDFSDVKKGPLLLSPVKVWSLAEADDRSNAPRSWTSIFSPFASTMQDCLNTAGSKEPIDQMVGDCLQFKQLPRLKSERIHLHVAEAANPEFGQKQAANALADALCSQATEHGCTTPTD